MSAWINNFAGKAENLLNTIDQNAARMLDPTEETNENEEIPENLLEKDLNFDQNDAEQEDFTQNEYNANETNSIADESLSRIQHLDEVILYTNNLLKESRNEVERLQGEIQGLHRDHEDYRLKAKKILLDKDKIISELKSGGSRREMNLGNGIEREEIKQIAHERDSLLEEASRLSRSLENAEAKITILLNESDVQRRNLDDESIKNKRYMEEEGKKRSEIQKELELKMKAMQLLEDQFSREQASYLKSIETRDAEIEQMREQLEKQESELSNSTTAPTNTDKRISDLTSALVQRQSLVYMLQSEKTSLSLQVEKLENELRNHQALSSISPNGKLVQRFPTYQSEELHNVFVESPFESHVTRNVKKAYSSIDSFSVWIGILLRRYPLFRIGVMAYGVILHLWVFTVLFQSVPDASK
eukprot:TRINITY_DN25910_c0_g1_i1.p1 TRINITY_DN25910_c0_g1~~TRINITY_DN25910_c0_g1_i1.p1  ORF type:complete len:416 (+),score=51.87 TRINITY_DN25910_c0_g1_i1:114-1361(+)